MAQAKTNNTPITESFGTPDVFVSELAALENLGPCFRLTFTTNQASHDGSPERIATSKLIISADALHQMLLDVPLMMRNLPDLQRQTHYAPEDRIHLN